MEQIVGNKNRGQVSTAVVIGWGITIALAAIGSMSVANRYTDGKIEKLGDTLGNTGKEVAGLQAQLPDIKQRLESIEKKLDLIISNGIIKKTTP
jgi:ABC-type transporter Mla subunit MlaD